MGQTTNLNWWVYRRSEASNQYVGFFYSSPTEHMGMVSFWIGYPMFVG